MQRRPSSPSLTSIVRSLTSIPPPPSPMQSFHTSSLPSLTSASEELAATQEAFKSLQKKYGETTLTYGEFLTCVHDFIQGIEKVREEKKGGRKREREREREREQAKSERENEGKSRKEEREREQAREAPGDTRGLGQLLPYFSRDFPLNSYSQLTPLNQTQLDQALSQWLLHTGREREREREREERVWGEKERERK